MPEKTTQRTACAARHSSFTSNHSLYQIKLFCLVFCFDSAILRETSGETSY